MPKHHKKKKKPVRRDIIIRNPKDQRAFDAYKPQVYGLHVPYDRGYGVATPDIDPAFNQANAFMLNQVGEGIGLWVEEIEANFEMVGTTGQSRKVRQFFPHNMVQPFITIRGQTPNSYQYNRLAAFIRASHYNALSGTDAKILAMKGAAVTYNNYRRKDKKGEPVGDSILDPTIQLTILSGTVKGFPYNHAKGSGSSVKGRHQTWRVNGYVKQIMAGAERFNHAPAYQFEFVVSDTVNAANTPWNDDRVAGSELAAWMDIFKGRPASSFVRDAGADRAPRPTHVPKGGVDYLGLGDIPR